MNHLSFLLAGMMMCLNIYAQTDTATVKVIRKNVVTVIESNDTSYVKIGGDEGIEVITNSDGDTTHIRIGSRVLNVIDGDDGTSVRITREGHDKKQSKRFNAHWAGLELGMNMFHQQDYSMYQNPDAPIQKEFMELRYGKSINVNLNLFEWAFTNARKNYGIVTGLGFNFMDYAFHQPVTIERHEGDGIIMPVDLEPAGLKKSKLTVSYLTAPLLLEIKTPLRMGKSNLYIAGGVIGGVYLGSHSKFKYDGRKEKSRSNFNLNQFKYDLTGRIGFGDFTVFVNYGKTPLFNDNMGPKLIPVTYGISLINF